MGRFGRRYVIDLEDIGNGLWRAKGFRTLVFDEVGMNKLTSIEDAFEEEVNHAVEKAIKDRIDIEAVRAEISKAKRIGFIHGLEKAVKILASEGAKE